MKVVDLFAGAGGMSLGFSRAGFSVVAGIDNWDSALECYRINFPAHKTFKMDLQNWKSVVDNLKGIPVDLIMGGPPCQDFSEAGNQVEGDRANLTRNFARIIAKLRPKYFVMENVPRAQISEAYRKARGIFKREKYGLTEIVLDASLCGVPQRRKRFFCIGSLSHKNGFLTKTLLVHQRDVPMTVRDYLGKELCFKYYYRHPRTYDRRGVFSVDEPAPTIRGCNRPMPNEYKKHRDDVVDPHRENVRALTFKERARIQMFPPDYKWPQQSSVTDQMIGNAVPVGLAEYVGRCLLGFLEKGDKYLPMTFVAWLCRNKHMRMEAAGDNLSRYRRVKKLLIGRVYDENEILTLLGTLKVFQDFSQPIQNHLYRACKLHSEYVQYLKKVQDEERT